MLRSTSAWVVMLGVARAVGKLVAMLMSPFVLNALLLGAIIVVLAALDIADVAKSGQADHWLTANRVLAIWALALIAWWVLRQRRRLLIARFDDLSGDKGATTGAATGMSILLANELVQLRDLFQEFEEGHAIQSTADDVPSTTLGPGRSELFEAAIQVDAQGGFLESAVSAESTLAVGPLKIPMNILLGLVNRLVQGPRLSGQVQSDGGRRIVTIDLTAGRLQRQWRVEDAANAPPRSSTDLARELAIRIFADLAFERPARWTAVASLIEGLRAYRRTLRTTKERRLNLLAAERCLLDTITEDNRFDLAHYNLGVVYAALDRPPAARSAFARSIELNPQRFDSQYALARVLYVGAVGKNIPAAATDLRVALDHCDRALSLAGDAEARAKVLNQKAVVQMELKGLDFFFAAVSCRAAVRSALRALLAAELATTKRSGLVARRRMQARALASSSLQQLVAILRLSQTIVRQTPGMRRLHLEGLARRQRLSAARLAAWLAPNDVDAHVALGVYWLERARPRRAIGPLRHAAQLAPERGNAWCSLALANAMLYRPDQFGPAYEKAMDAIGATADTFLPDLAQAFRIFAARTRYVRMRVVSFASKVTGRASGPSSIGRTIRAVGLIYGLAYFLSGRRLRRWAGSMYDLQTRLQQRDQWIAQITGQIGWLRTEAARIRRLPERRALVEALLRDPKDRSTDLEVHYKEGVERKWAWEAGDAATALGRVAMRFGRAGDARRHFEAAIEVLTPMHPPEIVRRALHARLARSLSAIGERGRALDSALRAVEMDPVSNFERDSLADCHFELKEWAAARAQWEESLRLAPDDPVTYHNIALCCYNEGGSADKAAERRAWFTHAADNLERALSLFPSEDQRRLDSQFLLGKIKGTLGDVRGGQALWQVLESRAFRPLYLGLHLADSMLQREASLDQAQAMFARWSDHVATEAKTDPEIMNRTIDGLPGDPSQTTYSESLVWAELGIAAAIARRQGGFDEALVHAGKARTAAEQIMEEATRLQWLGNCDRLEGEILLRQGAPARAIPLLERALLRTTNAEAYRFLAAALLDQLEPSAVDAGARATAMRIKTLLDHAVKLDLDEEIKQPIAELRGQLGSTAAGKAIAWSAT